jgi:hypothetical protein
MDSLANFRGVHGPQLQAIGFPSSLVEKLYTKLRDEIFDAGTCFAVTEDPSDGRRSVCYINSEGITVYSVTAKRYTLLLS